MWTTATVELEVPRQARLQLRHRLVAHQVHVFVLHAPPQPLDEHVVQSPTAAIHADRNPLLLQHACIRSTESQKHRGVPHSIPLLSLMRTKVAESEKPKAAPVFASYHPMQMVFDVFAQIFGTLWAHKLRSLDRKSV